MNPAELDSDLAARAAYQAHCASKGIKPNWGKSGFQARVAYWRTIAEAAVNPIEVARTQSSRTQRSILRLEPDLSNLSLTMNAVIPVMREFLGIPESHASKFAGNLKHFQRNGFPAGLHTGRGRPAVFSREQFLQFAFALLLYHNGLTPCRVIQIIGSIWPELHSMIDVMITAECSGIPADPAMLIVYPAKHPDQPPTARLQSLDQVMELFKVSQAPAWQALRVDIALCNLIDTLRKVRPDLFD